jgi:hypothetical protein
MLPDSRLTIYALAANVILAACAFFLIPQQFAHEPMLCLTVAGVGCGAALATLVSFLIRDATVVATFLTLIGHGGALIFLFAGIYHGFGLVHAPASAVSASDGLYFSIVTWTTLGYGDFTPPPDISADRRVGGASRLHVFRNYHWTGDGPTDPPALQRIDLTINAAAASKGRVASVNATRRTYLFTPSASDTGESIIALGSAFSSARYVVWNGRCPSSFPSGPTVKPGIAAARDLLLVTYHPRLKFRKTYLRRAAAARPENANQAEISTAHRVRAIPPHNPWGGAPGANGVVPTRVGDQFIQIWRKHSSFRQCAPATLLLS